MVCSQVAERASALVSEAVPLNAKSPRGLLGYRFRRSQPLGWSNGLAVWNSRDGFFDKLTASLAICLELGDEDQAMSKDWFRQNSEVVRHDEGSTFEHSTRFCRA